MNEFNELCFKLMNLKEMINQSLAKRKLYIKKGELNKATFQTQVTARIEKACLDCIRKLINQI